MPHGRAAKIGDGRKVTLHSPFNGFVISFRLADYGLLVEFTLWCAGYGLSIHSDQFNDFAWLYRKT